jgi:hypothetical protein
MGRNNNNNNRSRNNGGGGNSNRNNDSNDRKKSTGCKSGIGPKSGLPWVSGWNLQTRRGMLSFIAGPYGKTSVHTSNNGRDWENWVAEFSINGFPQPGVMPCLYESATGKIIFKKLQMVANPKAPNGGYFGTFNE